MKQHFSSFREFYPFYLSEHANRTSRRLHFTGSCGALLFVVAALARHDARWLLAGAAFLVARKSVSAPIVYSCNSR